jgi:hypothetical protein
VYHLNDDDFNAFKDANLSPRNKGARNRFLRHLVVFINLLGLASLILRHYFRVLWIKNYSRVDIKKTAHCSLFMEYERILAEMHESVNVYENLIKFKSFKPDFYFIFECFVMMISPIPSHDFFIETTDQRDHFTDKTFSNKYYLNDVLFALMFVKIHFLIRVLESTSIYQDAHSMIICRYY